LTQSLRSEHAVCSLSDGSIAVVDLKDALHPTRIVRYCDHFKRGPNIERLFAFDSAYVIAHIPKNEDEDSHIELRLLEIPSADPRTEQQSSALGAALLSTAESTGDVRITYDDGSRRKVHSVILKVSGSEYFRGILKPGLSETQQPSSRKRIRADDEDDGAEALHAGLAVPENILRRVFDLGLDFCYTGSLPSKLDPSELLQVLEASEYLMFPPLEQTSLACFILALDEEWTGDYLLSAVRCLEAKLNVSIPTKPALTGEYARLLDRCLSSVLNLSDRHETVLAISKNYPACFEFLARVLKFN
jgi:hypothetical protein